MPKNALSSHIWNLNTIGINHPKIDPPPKTSIFDKENRIDWMPPIGPEHVREHFQDRCEKEYVDNLL